MDAPIINVPEDLLARAIVVFAEKTAINEELERLNGRRRQNIIDYALVWGAVKKELERQKINLTLDDIRFDLQIQKFYVEKKTNG
jgi:hypothetical protein